MNLPFLCTKCGVCCTLDDFLTAGEINGRPGENPEVDAKNKALLYELGKMWEADEAKYETYITHTPCLFLINNVCSIYEIRPEGCRRFPNTAFGMQTQTCKALTRFKKQRTALKKGLTAKQTYHFTEKQSSATRYEAFKPTKFTEKQYQTCLVKLRQVGITEEELALFSCFNGRNRK